MIIFRFKLKTCLDKGTQFNTWTTNLNVFMEKKHIWTQIKVLV